MTNLYEAPPAPPAKKKRHLKRWIFLAVLAVIGLIVVVNVSKGGSASTTASPAAPVAAAPAAPAVSGIGTAVRDGKFEFVVQSVAPGVKTLGNQYINTTAQGEFILVTVQVTNTSDQPQTFSGSNCKAFDNAGRQLAPSTTAAIYLPDSNSLYMPINPGNSVVGTLVFDVPVGSTLTSLELHDSAFSGGVTVQL
jgi:hypothetical protein